VTFLDNHDENGRFYYQDPAEPHRWDGQATMALGCLFALQGIPCVYYGTEQGLHGHGGRREAVREALWGAGPSAFDPGHPFYEAIQRLAAVRAEQPALRYGRQYFRPVAGDGAHFGHSPYPGGVLAFSRILNDQEVLVVANADAQAGHAVDVLVDRALNPEGTTYVIAYSNQSAAQAAAPQPVAEKPAGTIEIRALDGTVTQGPARSCRVTLRPLEAQILVRAD
jgi:glycosidase